MTETRAEKVCFVTTGATAPFTELIESVLSPSCLNALSNKDYTHLLIQYGTAKEVFERSLKMVQHQESQTSSISISGQDFAPHNLLNEFTLVQRTKGLVISHAGSGTILEALRYQLPLIVVPNTSLLDNHQEELAVAMEDSNYVIHGNVKDLVPAILASEPFRTKMAQFPPPTSGTHRETKSFAAIMDETMGLLD